MCSDVNLSRRYYYDPGVDALALDDVPYDYGYSVAVNSEIILSFSRGGELIGVEILNCVECYGFDQEALSDSNDVRFHVLCDGRVLRLKLVFIYASNDLVCHVRRCYTYRVSCTVSGELRGWCVDKWISWRL